MDTRRLIVERLRAHPDEIHRLTDGLTEVQLKERPSDGKWSLHELAMHVCEAQDVFIERLARMLTEDNPQLSSYEPDEARQSGLYFAEHFGNRLKEFEVQRSTLASLLQTLTKEQWLLEAAHPEFKHYTVQTSMESLMRHEEHHLYQMYNVFLKVRGH